MMMSITHRGTGVGLSGGIPASLYPAAIRSFRSVLQKKKAFCLPSHRFVAVESSSLHPASVGWMAGRGPPAAVGLLLDAAVTFFPCQGCSLALDCDGCQTFSSVLLGGGFDSVSCLSAAISAFALAALVLPGSYPHYLDLISSLSVGPVLIGMAKFGLAFPVSYHTYNGIRHLVSRRDSLALMMMIHLPLFPK